MTTDGRVPIGTGDDSSPVDVLIIGAGIIGIYALYKVQEAGFSVTTFEQGEGVGGVWYWNRYPGARFDSESYAYAYLFSEELFDEWEWSEHFAGQPDIERYLNHVVDRFDLRQHIQFGAKVVSAEYDEQTGTWTVTAADGRVQRARFVLSVTGGLSVPYFPDVPGRDDFAGISHHTGLWPAAPVDFAGKRVAVVGTGPSGVQIVPAIADQVASLTVYQRTPNWCTPLNNRPITADEQATLRREFEAIRETLNTAPSGFLHTPCTERTFDVDRDERWAFFEKIWHSPGFSKLSSNYIDITTDKAANAEFCDVPRREDPRHRRRPGARRQADPRRPRLRRETTAVRDRLLRDLQQPEGVPRRSQGDADGAGHRNGYRDDRRPPGVRHHRLGDRLRLRDRRPHADGCARVRRTRARGALGRRPDRLPRFHVPRLPEPLLPRRPARCRRWQLPAVRERPDRLHRCDARLHARPRLLRDRRRPRPRRRTG